MGTIPIFHVFILDVFVDVVNVLALLALSDTGVALIPRSAKYRIIRVIIDVVPYRSIIITITNNLKHTA